jgi:hypothetical protein
LLAQQIQMAKQINKVKKTAVMKPPAKAVRQAPVKPVKGTLAKPVQKPLANPVKQAPANSVKQLTAIPADEAAASVRRFIDRGMSDNSIWAELEAEGFTSKKLGQFFVTEIRKGGSPEKKPPHRPYPPKAPRPN